MIIQDAFKIQAQNDIKEYKIKLKNDQLLITAEVQSETWVELVLEEKFNTYRITHN